MVLRYNYVPQDKEKNLITYKYTGRDNSILYKYVFSPLADYQIKYIVPKWIAPNVLTLMGFLCVVIPFIMIWVQAENDMTKVISPGYFLFAAVMFFLYFNFDNLDGKQARATDNGSPLGLLFDHGCDAMTVVLGGINTSISMIVGNNFHGFTILLLGSFPFYFSTLEEYYTDLMYLPIINGAVEGILIVNGIFFCAGFFGQEWYLQTSIFGITNSSVVQLCVLVICILSFPGFLYRVYQKRPNKIWECLYNFTFYIFVYCAFAYIYYYSPTNVGQDYTRVMMMIAGFTYAKLKTLMQMCHVSGTGYQQFRRSNFIVIMTLVFNTASGHILGTCLIDEPTLLYVAMVMTLLIHLHLLANIIVQFCDVLKIRAFKVKPVKYDRFDAE